MTDPVNMDEKLEKNGFRKNRAQFLTRAWAGVLAGGNEAAIVKLLLKMDPNATREIGVAWGSVGRPFLEIYRHFYSRKKEGGSHMMLDMDMNMSALMYAVMACNFAAIKVLITAGADIDQRDNLGRTALMVGISEGMPASILRLLIDAGVDLNIEDKNDCTVLETRRLTSSGWEISSDLVRMLLAAGAKPRKVNCEVVLHTVLNGFAYEAILLLERGARISIEEVNFLFAAKPCFEQIARVNLNLLKSQIDCGSREIQDQFEMILRDFGQVGTISSDSSDKSLGAGDIATEDELPEVLRPGRWPKKLNVLEPVKIKASLLRRHVLLSKGPISWPDGSKVSIVSMVHRPEPTLTNDRKFDAAAKKFTQNSALMPFEVLARARGLDFIDFWNAHAVDLTSRVSLKSRPNGLNSEDLTWFIQSLGLPVLPGILDVGRQKPALAMDALLLVDALDGPELMEQWSVGESEARIAKQWIREFIIDAIHKILPGALGVHGGRRRTAEQMLRTLVEHGHRETIDKIAAAYEVETALAEVLAVEPGVSAETIKVPKLPAYWMVKQHPPPRLTSGKLLPGHAIETLVKMMLVPPSDRPIMELQEIMAVCDRQSLARFSWSVFENWAARGKMDSDGLFHALGYLGDDECASNLTPYILDWPKQHYTARATLGVQILEKIGSDTAWRQIQTISFKSDLRTVAYEAKDVFSKRAHAQELTISQFEDCLIPSLGLEKDGTFSLDIGPELFSASVDEQLRPILRDGLGNIMGGFPSVIKGKTNEFAENAAKRWSDFCASLVPVAVYELRRLERAMVESKRWRGDQFIELLASHPLMQSAVRSLVWCLYKSKRGSGLIEFAADTDGNFCDLEGLPVVVVKDAIVGIPHPLNMANSLDAWGKVFSQRKQRQAFPQLVRKFFRMEDDVDQDLFGFQGAKVPSTDLYALEVLPGWGRHHNYGEDDNGQGYLDGYVTKFFRDFVSGRVDLEVDPGGFRHDYKYHSNEQKLTFWLPVTLTAEDFSELIRELATATTGVKLKLPQLVKVSIAPVQLATLVAPCPTCKGLVKEGDEGYSCIGPQDGQESQGCGFAFKKTHSGRTFNVVEAEQLVRDGRIGPLKGFISKAGAPFAAQMFFNFNKTSQNYRLQFDFDNDTKPDSEGVVDDFSNQTSLGQCPKCSGAVFAQEKDYVCINSVASPTKPKPSCNFKTGRNVLQQSISQEQVGKLLSTGRTDLLEGFVSSRTQKKFTAMLVWDTQTGKVNFEFGSKR